MLLNKNNSNLTATVFDIQGLSVHDGPGCRTLIFFNGCTLNCFWCSNPEGISRKPSPMYFSSRCIVCGNCVKMCVHNAIHLENEKIIIERKYCNVCDNQSCTEECYTDALKLSGYEISISKLYDIIQRDRKFWGSEGGITLTGGEPLLQIDFAEEILTSCHEAYIHTAIETCGNVPSQSFSKVMPFLDWIFFDLKHLNNEEHKKATGIGNMLIQENAKLLSREFEGRLIFRLPLIPGFNDSNENINDIISFIKKAGKNEINILPLHHLGREKYPMLSQEYHGMAYAVPTNQLMREIEKQFKAAGIHCYIGSETPF
jgi:pyruvate formate lyase activating enzyme